MLIRRKSQEFTNRDRSIEDGLKARKATREREEDAARKEKLDRFKREQAENKDGTKTDDVKVTKQLVQEVMKDRFKKTRPDSDSDSSGTDASFVRPLSVGAPVAYDPYNTIALADRLHDAILNLAHHIGCKMSRTRAPAEHDTWEQEDVTSIAHASHALHGMDDATRMRRVADCESALQLLELLADDHL